MKPKPARSDVLMAIGFFALAAGALFFANPGGKFRPGVYETGALIEPLSVSQVASSAAGIVKQVHVQPGDIVEVGDALLEITTREHVTSSGTSGSPGRNVLEASFYDFPVVETGDSIVVRAPISGTVLSVDTEVGKATQASSDLPMVEIADLTKMKALVAVKPQEAHEVKKGMRVVLSQPKKPNAPKWVGPIHRVEPMPVDYDYAWMGVVSSSVRVYHAVVELDNAEGILLPGMVMKASVLLE